jgi:hypothetical protein
MTFLIDINMIHAFANFHQSQFFILSFLLVVIRTSIFFVHSFKKLFKLFSASTMLVFVQSCLYNNGTGTICYLFKNAIEISYRW